MTSYCVFNVGERRVGIALDHVREIIEPRLVVPTPIPLTPSFVHGLFNLRGQILPYLDLSPFVGAKEAPAAPGPEERAVIVERGQLRFATTGRRIDTVEADPNTFAPVENAALLPALDAEASTDYGRFHVIHLDRLEACLTQSLKLAEAPAAPAQPPPIGETATARTSEPATAQPSDPATARNGEPATARTAVEPRGAQEASGTTKAATALYAGETALTDSPTPRLPDSAPSTAPATPPPPPKPSRPERRPRPAPTRN